MRDGRTIAALPTRDAVLPMLALLAQALHPWLVIASPQGVAIQCKG